jgi:hypothetical protein
MKRSLLLRPLLPMIKESMQRPKVFRTGEHYILAAIRPGRFFAYFLSQLASLMVGRAIIAMHDKLVRCLHLDQPEVSVQATGCEDLNTG